MTNVDALTIPSSNSEFERWLVSSLQPIRGFALASTLYHLFDLGIAAAILDGDAQQISSLANRLELDPGRLRGVLLFLQVEGFVTIEDDIVRPLDRLSQTRRAWPWYEMLIGGYAQTYLEMGKGLRAGSGALSRNAACVGSGSCKISHYDAIPLTATLLGHLRTSPAKIVDLGCGNALYLKEFCSLFPGLVAIGVEPDAIGHAQSATDLGVSQYRDQIRLHNATAQDYISTTDERDVDAIVIAFVLQEILGQSGRDGVIEFLKQIALKFPHAHVVVIEVNNKIEDISTMRHPLAQSYYNPYYLVHYFTDQALEPSEFWSSVFSEAGFQRIAYSTTNAEVDSTGLTLGFLLKHA